MFDYLLGRSNRYTLNGKNINLHNESLYDLLSSLSNEEELFLIDTITNLKKYFNSPAAKYDADINTIISIATNINSIGVKQLIDFASRLQEKYSISATSITESQVKLKF